ncbi:hypothetical protein [Shimazuella alba]|uniref:Uncharacterized protein n=1 Tax=Shimazuella alba TaxID=2690964 RepID=A0A6I4VYZ2_9BACL|nr:hypothetical protein [Shimazuella alba]MXQ56001.1 hypothetical protein [Shimazuella alba]
MTIGLRDDLISSLEAQIALDVNNIQDLKEYFKDEEHSSVIKARQQLTMKRMLVRLLNLPVEQFIEVVHMDDPALIRQALEADDLNDITLVHQVLESAERVANGDQIEFEFTVLTVWCVYYLAPFLK